MLRLFACFKVFGFPSVSVFIVLAEHICDVSAFNFLGFCLLYLISYLCTLSSIPLSLIVGTYSQSAAIQLRGSLGGGDHPAEGPLSRLSTPTPTNHDSPRVPQQNTDLEHRLGQPIFDPVPGSNKKAADSMEGAEIVRVGVSKAAGQGSGGGGTGVSGYYRPTRRGSPRPSTHDHFDINEHLPWMIVLLLLLVLVVIVICSVKRSSRVLKKGPVQDPSSIIEKAIQKKAAAPPTQLKEKWIYYSNGQGKL